METWASECRSSEWREVKRERKKKKKNKEKEESEGEEERFGRSFNCFPMML